MEPIQLKNGRKVQKKKQINYLVDNRGKLVKYKPWLGDLFSFLYDRIMEKSVFPKKFEASANRHIEILKDELRDIHGRIILEVATGTGNAVQFLNPDNYYVGTDISAGLLRRAVKNFENHGFQNFAVYVAHAGDMPFSDGQFDLALCHLSMNFFSDLGSFLSESYRVLQPGGVFYGSVPIPEKKPPRSTIHGTLYS